MVFKICLTFSFKLKLEELLKGLAAKIVRLGSPTLRLTSNTIRLIDLFGSQQMALKKGN